MQFLDGTIIFQYISSLFVRDLSPGYSGKVECAYKTKATLARDGFNCEHGQRTIHFGYLCTTVTAKDREVTTLSDCALGFILRL